MAKQKTETLEAQNPLILRCHRLMEAFAKSDDERDFYLDRQEGFMIFADLDKGQDSIVAMEQEVAAHPDRYVQIPKLTFYETKKIMEGFVNEKVYDIDTKEKLLDIIQSKEARENFLEFIYDHPTELEKWQQFYQERFRIRIIEWLRDHEIVFVFEEDLELTRNAIEKVKMHLFEDAPPKDVATSRKALNAKAKTYYSNEALNPRPKRGRPPKQAAKVEVEPTMTMDHYQTVPKAVRPFLFTPDVNSASAVTFSAKFDSKEELLASLKNQGPSEHERTLESLNQRLASLRRLSTRLLDEEQEEGLNVPQSQADLLEAVVEKVELEAEEAAAPAPKRTAAPKRKGIKKKDTEEADEAKDESAKKPAKRRLIRKKPSS